MFDSILLLSCKALFCYISAEDKQWGAHGLWKDRPWGNLTSFVCLWLFFLEAGNDLKGALFCLANSYFVGILCSIVKDFIASVDRMEVLLVVYMAVNNFALFNFLIGGGGS